ncbi:hypothetical protein [Mangrovicella endophytica]|nr:hypothetical protein [Mangrovicella endophytica]
MDSEKYIADHIEITELTVFSMERIDEDGTASLNILLARRQVTVPS